MASVLDFRYSLAVALAAAPQGIDMLAASLHDD